MVVFTKATVFLSAKKLERIPNTQSQNILTFINFYTIALQYIK